jgi:hypothetical protein
MWPQDETSHTVPIHCSNYCNCTFVVRCHNSHETEWTRLFETVQYLARSVRVNNAILLLERLYNI